MFATPYPLRDLLRDATPRGAIRSGKDNARGYTAGLPVECSLLQELPDFVDRAGIDALQTCLPPVNKASPDLY